jgi:hypothetical protein
MENFEALVPELYYDLIVRLMPGTLAAYAIVVNRPTLAAPLRNTNGVVVMMVALTAAYTLGMLLQAASGATLDPLSKGVCWIAARAPVLRTSRWRAFDQIDARQIMRSFEGRGGAHVIGKMRAERSFLRSLTLLCPLLWVFSAEPVCAIPVWMRLLLTGLLFVWQYQWDYLSRSTAKQVADSEQVRGIAL